MADLLDDPDEVWLDDPLDEAVEEPLDELDGVPVPVGV